MRCVIIPVLGALLVSPALAQQGATWNFAGLSGSSASVAPGSNVPANATDPLVGALSPITRGAGLTAAAGTGVFAGGSFAAGLAFNFANNDYFEFTYTAPAQGGTRLSGVSQTLQRITAPGATQTRWFVSTNGTFTSTSAFPVGNVLSGAQSAPGNTQPYGGSGTFSTPLRLNGGQSITFRLYGWNGANGSLSLNAASLTSTIAYTNSLAPITWDRGINPGFKAVDAAPYSYFGLSSYIAGLGPNSSAIATYGITAQSGPSTLLNGVDFNFDSATRLLTLNDTSNVALGTYTFDYTLSVDAIQDGAQLARAALDTGTITITVVPAPASLAALAGSVFLFARRRR